jgi:excisionase family DNA binding protein
MHTMSLEGQSQVLAPVPSMLDVPEAARMLGIGRTLAYELVRTGEWPTPVVRVGRLIKIPSGPLIELLATGRALKSDLT